MCYTTENEAALESLCLKTVNDFEIDRTVIKNKGDPSLTQNERVYATCCRPEVGDDVISGEDVETLEGYVVVNFEDATCSVFRNIKIIS